MPTLLLHFPARRYHATPFGHHVNEGLIEWPPSPWRLLRALLSVGYCKRGWTADMRSPLDSSPPDVARALIAKLASVLPTYVLPPAIGAHTRHYMPIGGLDGSGRENTTLVFDTWAQIESGKVAVNWDVALAPTEAALLGELAAELGYLGRSESWVVARLAPDDHLVEPNCRPCEALFAAAGPGWEQVMLLAPQPARDFEQWRTERVAALAAEILPTASPTGRAGRPPNLDKAEAARRKAAEPYPPDLLACLQADTQWHRKHGWSQPPGSRRVLYWRRSDALQAPADGVAQTFLDGDRPRFVLMALTSATGNDHALPPIARSLPQGELLHSQLVAARARLAPSRHSRALTGCDEQGLPLREAHTHAHLLSLDLDDDGHIDHLLVWAPMGLDQDDQRALRSARNTYTKGGVGPLRLAVSGTGAAADLNRLPAPYGPALRRTVGPGRVWLSATPFVLPRHLKSRGAHRLEGQIQAELTSRGLPVPLAIECIDAHHSEGECGDLARRLRHHIRVRRRGAAPPMDTAFAIRLTFDGEIGGPICLGYGSHFGLGRFDCVDR